MAAAYFCDRDLTLNLTSEDTGKNPLCFIFRISCKITLLTGKDDKMTARQHTVLSALSGLFGLTDSPDGRAA